MDSNEIKDALLKGYPVEYGGRKYDCVSGIIYRKGEKGISVTLELLDRKHNSITVCQPSKVKKVE